MKFQSEKPTGLPPNNNKNVGHNKHDDLSYLDDLLDDDLKDDQSSGTDQDDVEENVVGINKTAENFGIMNASFKFGHDFNKVNNKRTSHNGTITV